MKAYRTYTPEERASAVARAAVVGSKQASVELGIPRRTISSWLGGEHHPEVVAVAVATREEMGRRLWETIVLGTDVLAEKLRTPNARLGDVSRALEVAIQAHALLTGGVTARTANLNLNADVAAERMSAEDRETVRRFTDDVLAMTDDEIRAYLAGPEGVAVVNLMRDDAAMPTFDEPSDG